uniref:Putative ovule protein n=1 Tax=Solanum chacoense TaxID=4108 RepID=A0A0V0I0Z5_SOLCH
MLLVCFNSLSFLLALYTTLFRKNCRLNSSHVLIVHKPILASVDLRPHHSMAISDMYNTTMLILASSPLTFPCREKVLQVPKKVLYFLCITNPFEHWWLGSLDLCVPRHDNISCGLSHASVDMFFGASIFAFMTSIVLNASLSLHSKVAMVCLISTSVYVRSSKSFQILSISSRVCLSRTLRVTSTLPKHWPNISIASIPALTFMAHSLSSETSSGRTSTSSLLASVVEGSWDVSLSFGSTSSGTS